ncbi:MAG: DnaJ domain-containing protein [Firmicutes bacterium]|nr:DnaJ domain-containing protein [Bacillota bacterium]
MFKDYYQILGIPLTSSRQDIKKAYRKLSLKWHPDKNPGIDVTEIMQGINEAYKILYDEKSRARYDIEYQIFDRQRRSHQVKKWQEREEYWNYDYDVKDDNLKKDIEGARNYARELVRDFLKGLKETSKVAAKGAWEGAYGYIIAGIFLTIIFGLIRACI